MFGLVVAVKSGLENDAVVRSLLVLERRLLQLLSVTMTHDGCHFIDEKQQKKAESDAELCDWVVNVVWLEQSIVQLLLDFRKQVHDCCAQEDTSAETVEHAQVEAAPLAFGVVPCRHLKKVEHGQIKQVLKFSSLFIKT